MRIGQWNTHPAADCVRLMHGAEFDALVESVRIEGLRHRIVLIEDTDPDTGEVQPLVLDGRNRLRACIEAGVEPLFATYTGDDPWTYVATTRIRASMNASERAYMAAEMMPALQREAALRRGTREKVSGERKGAAREIAADICGVNEAYVSRANHVRQRVEDGTALPELYALLREGEATVSDVRAASDWPLEAQHEAVAEMKGGKALRELVKAREPEPAPVVSLAKDAPIRSRKYLDFVRARSCAWCSRPGPSEASHHPRRDGGSVGAKCCDLRAIALCTADHAAFHQRGSLGSMDGEQTRQWAEEQIVECLRAFVRERLEVA